MSTASNRRVWPGASPETARVAAAGDPGGASLLRGVAAFCVLLSVLIPARAPAQFLPPTNPSDTDRLESSFTNPAVGGFIDNRLTAGFLAHYTGFEGGFTDLSTMFFSYHMPWEARWLEIGGQYFNSDRYGQGLVEASGAYALWDRISLGVGVGMGFMSFDNTNNPKADAGDPVLLAGSKNYPTISAGAIVWPMPTLMVGASVQHLNRPNVSLTGGYGNVVEPARLSVGATYIGRNFRVGVAYVGQELGRREIYGPPGELLFHGETMVAERLPVLFSASQNEMTAEGRFQAVPGLFFSYTFEHPLTELNDVVSGSHRFALIWDFDYLPRLPLMAGSIPIPEPKILGLAKDEHRKFLYAYGDTDTLNIHQQNFKRIIDKDKLAEIAKLLDKRELDAIYNIERGGDYPEDAEPLEVKDPLMRLEGTYTPGYLGALGDMSLRMQTKAAVEGKVVAFPGSQERAVSVLNFLTGADKRCREQIDALVAADIDTVGMAGLDSLLNLPSTETVYHASPDSMVITVLGIHMEDYAGPWTLVILDDQDRTIHEIQGSPENIDRQISWNWRLADGSYLPAGEFSMYVRWIDENGDVRHSSRRFFDVVKRVTSLTIEITREARPDRKIGDRYHLYLSE